MARLIPTLLLLVSCLPWGAWAGQADPVATEFMAYDDRPPPKVPPRKEKLTFYPCSQCHEHWKTIDTPRQLAPVHDVGLVHGEGRLWCLECHDPDNRDSLHTVRGGKVDLDEAWRVCGQCHSARQKDWYYGGHGKRVENWQGEPQRYNCTHCHNPHQPPFMQRKAKPPPPVRAGLKPMKPKEHHKIPQWQRPIAKRLEDSHE